MTHTSTDLIEDFPDFTFSSVLLPSLLSSSSQVEFPWNSDLFEHRVPFYWTGLSSLASLELLTLVGAHLIRFGAHLILWMQHPISWTLHEEPLQLGLLLQLVLWIEALPFYLCSSTLTVFLVWRHKNGPYRKCSNCDDLFECTKCFVCVCVGHHPLSASFFFFFFKLNWVVVF